MLIEKFSLVWNELRSAARYRWIALLVAAAIAVAGWAAVLMLPNQYESQAQIHVSSDSILRPLLQGIAVSTDTGSAADVVRRALLARPNIERVAQVNGLIRRGRSPEEVEATYAKLQKDITITGGEKQFNIYTVTYTGESGQVAHDVVKTLIDTFVQDSIGAGRTDAENAQRFLEQQVQEYKRRLSESEQSLAEFKKQYIGLMPDQRGDYFSRLQEEQSKFESMQGQYNVSVRQRDELRRKLVGASGNGALPVMPTDRQIQTATEIDGQLQDVRRQLEAALLRYTDKHPTIVALRDTMQRLEQRRQTELGSVRATVPGGSSSAVPGVDSVMQSLQIQLNTADVQVIALSTQVEEARRRVADLRRMLTIGPEVEAKLADLNRDYGVTKGQYDSLLQRLESAKISEQADRSKDMTIRTIDPPRVSPTPIAPLRGALIAGVLVFALGGGAAVAYLLNMLKPVFVDSKSIAEVLGLPVLGATSNLRAAHEELAKKLRTWRFATAVGALALFGVALAAVSHPASRLVRQAMGMV